MSIEKAKKIKALADGGFMNEKHTAKKILSDYCKKHGIDMEELNEVETSEFLIKYDSGTKEILIQIIGMVSRSSKIYGVVGRTQAMIFEGSESDHIRIEAMYDHYKKLYLEELEIFKRAFVHRNNLYPSGIDVNPKKVSQEELDKIRRSRKMSESVQKKDFNQQLKEYFK